MKNEKIYFFEKAPVPRAIANFALPMIFSMMVAIIYNLVDTFYIGLLGDYTLVAGLSLSIPVLCIFVGIGNIFGVGGGTYISRLLGSKDESSVKKASAFVFYGSIIFSLFVSLPGLIFMEPLLKLLGVSEATAAPTRAYMTVMLSGGVFKILSFSLMQIIRSEGSPKEAMFGNLFGTVINIILDPIFLFLLKWGVGGIAAATMISEIFSTLFYFHFIHTKSRFLSLKISDFKSEFKIKAEIFKTGFPTFLQSIILMVMNLVQNNIAAMFSDVYVAIFAIIFKLSLIPVLLSRGLYFGIQPLIAYNYSAKNFQRAVDILNKSFFYGIIFCIVFFISWYMGSGFFLHLFSHNSRIVSLGIPVMKISAVSFLTYPFIFLAMSVFQAIGEGKYSLIMSFAQGIFFLPLVLFSARIMEIYTFAWTGPISNILSALLGIIIFASCRNKFFRSTVH